MKRLLFALSIALGLAACRDEAGQPPWLTAKIDQIANEDVSNPPTRLYRFRYNGETVYYRPPRCCDQFGEVWRNDGSTLCYPDGGFSGRGDGRCADFASRRSECEVLWTDPRAKSGGPDVCAHGTRQGQAER